jgi:hypothetical protein
MKEEVRRAKAVQQEAQAAVYRYFTNPRNRLAYGQGSTGEVSVPEAVFGVSRRDFVAVTAIAWPDEKQMQKEIERLVGVTVPLEASEILEIGAVKAITHPGKKYWSGPLNSTIPYLQELQSKSLDSPDGAGPEVTEWKQTLPTFIQACIESAAQSKTIDDPTSYDYLRQEHFEHTWDLRFPDWKREESPTTFSFRPCFPIWETLQLSEIQKGIEQHSDGKPEFVGFALPLSSRPVSANEPWAHTCPQLFRNVFRCRYRLKITAPDAWQRFLNTQLWATLRGPGPESGLARYGSL